MIYAVTFGSDDTLLIPRMEAISSDWRLRRASPIRLPEGRLRSLAAGLLLDYALRAEGYAPLGEVRFGCHGKPIAEGVYFSITHCRGLAACAVAPYPVGIDAEGSRTFSPGVRTRAFSPNELREAVASADPDGYLTRLWTLKESLLKATGTGISVPLSGVSFSLAGGRVTGPPGCNYHLYTLAEGYSIALSCATSQGLPGHMPRHP